MSRDPIRAAVRAAYDSVGTAGSRPPAGLPIATGRALALELGYGEGDLAALPPSVLESFVGAAPLYREVRGRAGDWVVDLGCGAGTDALLLAARGFRVAAVDGSGSMLSRLGRAKREGVFPVLGELPGIPLRSGVASWVLLNGVANLVPHRQALWGEVYRVLLPGGRLAVADLLAVAPLSKDLRDLPEAWAWCIGGAASPETWRQELQGEGFTGVTIEVLEEMPPLARGIIRAQIPAR